MRETTRTVAAVLLAIPLAATSFSLSENAGRLREAFSSPSGKLTLSPEIVIPEPSDPTAILLQSSAVKTLSERIRTLAKANSAWISGSTTSVQSFCIEQEQSRGNFPGPVPVVYCPSGDCTADDMEALAEAGTAGILVTSSAEADEGMLSTCATAREAGLQPIPEVVTSSDAVKAWTEDDVTSLVENLASRLGFQPAGVLFTVDPVDDEETEVSLPTIPKALARQTPILGSVRVVAGEDRIGMETTRFKEAGFTGAILRSDCVPGFRMNPDLDVVGRFWSACIGDLKSTRSKSFSFRSKNKMEKSLSTEWSKYQKDVIDSGALGAPEDNYYGPGMDTDAGDYKGF